MIETCPVIVFVPDMPDLNALQQEVTLIKFWHIVRELIVDPCRISCCDQPFRQSGEFFQPTQYWRVLFLIR